MCGYDVGIPGASCAVLHTTTPAWISVTRVCKGRHCAHDAKCNLSYTYNDFTFTGTGA